MRIGARGCFGLGAPRSDWICPPPDTGPTRMHDIMSPRISIQSPRWFLSESRVPWEAKARPRAAEASPQAVLALRGFPLPFQEIWSQTWRCLVFSERGPWKSRPFPQDSFFILSRFLTVPGPGEGPPEAENDEKPPVLIFQDVACLGEIRSKWVLGPLPGSKRTSFPSWVRPWRRGGPPEGQKGDPCLSWPSADEPRSSK